MNNWEYCAITGLSAVTGSFKPNEYNPCFYYRFTSDGSKSLTRFNDFDSVARHIAKLGEDGWENGIRKRGRFSSHIMFFKRIAGN